MLPHPSVLRCQPEAGCSRRIKAGSGTDYDAILEDQLSEDGTTIDFYSNAYAENAPNGLTEATFAPSDGNKFYYYTQDTTLYIDQDCRTAATPRNSSNVDTFYYPIRIGPAMVMVPQLR